MMIDTSTPFFTWLEWTERLSKLNDSMKGLRDAQSLIRAVSAWTQDTDAWIADFTSEQKQGVIDLVQLKIDLLFQILNPPTVNTLRRPRFTQQQRLDFRMQYYEIVTLVATLERTKIVGENSQLRTSLNALTRWASNHTNWLP